MNLNNLKQKINKSFTKYPLVILILAGYAFFIGMETFSSGVFSFIIDVVNINSMSQDSLFVSSTGAMLNILIGILYFYVVKWIMKRDNRGRETLFYLTLMYVVIVLWGLSVLATRLLTTGIFDNSILNILMKLAFHGFILYLCYTESAKRYFRF